MQTITKTQPEKSLTSLLPKKSGRNNRGRVTVKGVGGREKRFYRQIDWKRDLRDLTGRVIAIEYDPGRNLNIALINYTNGKKRYILLPIGLAVGDKVISGALVDVKVGNALPLSSIPVGTPIHNIELSPGRGAQLARTAGSVAQIIAKEGKFAHIKMPSGELRMVSLESFATVGQLSNEEWKNVILGTAGRARHMGRRPKVRGTAQNPRSHPHGGGEGRSGEGMHPKTAQGKPARGKKTRKRNKYSNKY
ncbi:50S ribosomal protein L2, partial [Candidatus Gottesmanbacteria bacterium]|nr:50S ribosomal protein L2 [Candidatus Gottesmanbacteria bacterium]